jgi:hypothetical protein
MVIRLIIGVALFALAACQNGEELPVARGPWFGLNSGQYQPTAAELQPPVKQ